MTPAVFLDRDGVLNEPLIRNGMPHAPATLDQFRIAGDAPAACAALRAAGFRLIVITNQPDVSRGLIARAEVEAMHAELRARAGVDDIRVCYHDDRDRCTCRKPLPGMIVAAASDHGIDLARSFIVGDRWKDIEAGRRAGCRTVFIDRDYADAVRVEADSRARSLAEAAAWILDHGATGDGATRP